MTDPALVPPCNHNGLLPNARKWLANGWMLAGLAAASFAAPAANADVLDFDALTIGANANESFVQMMLTPIGFGLVLLTNSLTIAPTGTLNLKQNTLIVRQTPYASILPYVVTGYDGGLWDGFGINSSIAAADPDHLTAIGIIDNAVAQYPTFAGRTLGPAAEVLARYTYYGDSNLDGDVTLADYALFGTGAGWYHGDFNYDGVVDTADVALINASYYALHGEQAPPVMPEPGTLSLLAAGVACMVGRHRRS